MKVLSLAIVATVISFASLTILTGCPSQQQPSSTTVAPPETTEVPTTVEQSSTTEAPPAPTTTWESAGPNCPQPGPGVVKCYNDGACKGLYASVDDLLAHKAEVDASGCISVDGAVVAGGFGPCAECQMWHASGKISVMAKSMKALTQDQIKAARDNKVVIKADPDWRKKLNVK